MAQPLPTAPRASAAILTLLLATIFAVITAWPAHARSASSCKEQIVIGLCDYYPPFYGQLNNGQWRGVFIDFLHTFEAEHPAFAISFKTIPRKRMDKALAHGDVGAFGLTSPLFLPVDKHAQYIFSAPLWRMCDHVVVRADDPFEYTGPQSLTDKPLGLIHGNGYGPLDRLLHEGKIRAERVQGGPRLVRMLLSGHVDRAVLNDVTEREAMRRMGIPADAVRFLSPPLYCFDLSIQVRREHSLFIEAINDFIDEARIRGLLDLDIPTCPIPGD